MDRIRWKVARSPKQLCESYRSQKLCQAAQPPPLAILAPGANLGKSVIDQEFFLTGELSAGAKIYQAQKLTGEQDLQDSAAHPPPPPPLFAAVSGVILVAAEFVALVAFQLPHR